MSNAQTEQKGFGSIQGNTTKEISLDLTQPLPKDLESQFPVVFNHTTLEHVFPIDTAFANLCTLSSDALIVVVPLLQHIHIAPSFGDYWRPTALGLYKLCIQNGFTPLVISTNDQPFNPVYAFLIAVRDPKKYDGVIESSLNFESGAALFGSGLKKQALEKLLSEIN